MATITKRKNKKGKILPGWKAIIRIQGHPTICKIWDRKEEAEDWAKDTELKIKEGRYNFGRRKQKLTFDELIARYITSGALEHHKAAQDTLRHLEYWKIRFKSYAIVHLTPEFISEERQVLITHPTAKGKSRSPSTVNRYMAALSSVLTYAYRELRWIDSNPCSNLVKLKEPMGRNRVLSSEEIHQLLAASQESRSPYLYPIILIALTTGMRQGEILGLKWTDIDFEKHIAHLRDTKNSTPRSTPLVDPVVAVLKQLHKQSNPLKEYVFASRTLFGEKIDIKKSWQEALKRAKISNLRFHDLRHTFATLAARQGASNIELATAMGHKTLQMVKRYTHMEAEATRKYSIGITQILVSTGTT
jgi:integrase